MGQIKNLGFKITKVKEEPDWLYEKKKQPSETSEQ